MASTVLYREKSKNEVRERKGLSQNEVFESRKKYGENTMSKTKRKSFFRQFIENLGDPVIRILLFALILNVIFIVIFHSGDYYEAIGIGISVFLATFISTLSEYRGERAFCRLNEDSENSVCRAIRDGKITEIPVCDVVVGDIILISAGEKIPADGVLISGALSVDQSAMTGEGREVTKKPIGRAASAGLTLNPSQSYSLLGGCNVMGGEGEAKILYVGDESFLGKISTEVQAETRESPLKLRLRALARSISKIGYFAAVLVGVAYLLDVLILDSAFHLGLILLKIKSPQFLLTSLLNALMLSLTVIVVAVPEGLPMMIAVVLSSNIKKMVKDKVLVRKPTGIEAAGSMNILFTDKTGTLTEGKMTLSEFLLADGDEITPQKSSLLKAKVPNIMKSIAESAFYNTSSSIVTENGKRKIIGGNMTDAAITESMVFYESFIKNKASVLEKIPFDSAKKFSAVKIKAEKEKVLIKGAPEILLPHILDSYDSEGRKQDFKPEYFKRLLSKKASEGKRVVLLCEGSKMPRGQFYDMTLLCAAVLCDKVRKEAPRSVRSLQDAGIQVVMITGDNIDTAKSIAKSSGILNSTGSICLTSEELSRLSDKALSEIMPRLSVVARALPSDKSRLVRVAQNMSLVVGMTGDGINDAPALKKADIGFSMGSGTAVAKEAGDIIILDNNLASIVKAVLYGRNIFKSIRKFISLQLTMNLSAVGISMLGPFIGVDSPVTVVQMLWINIIMDTLGGLAFAGEAPLVSLMKEKPKRRDELIMNKYMINEILLLGGFTICLSVAFLKMARITSLFRYGENNIYLLTAFFALFIFASVFNCFNARTDSLNIFRGIGKNKIFVFIMLTVAVIQVVFVYLGGDVLRTAPLTAREMKITVLLALSVFPFDFLRKCFLRFIGSKNIGY